MGLWTAGRSVLVGGLGLGIFFYSFAMPLGTASQLPPVKAIRRVECNADAFFRKQRFRNFLPRLVPLAQLVNEIEVRFQNAVERSAAAF